MAAPVVEQERVFEGRRVVESVPGGVLVRGVGVLFVAMSCASCFAVTDLDRFQQREQTQSNFSDLRIRLSGFTSHSNEYFEYRVVDASNVIQSRGIAQPLGGVEAVILAKGAVPRQNGPFRLDFFSDHDRIPGYSDTAPGVNGDHAWRIPLEDSLRDQDGAYQVMFQHNTSFSFLGDPVTTEFGKPATVRVVNVAQFAGKRVEVRIADDSSGRVVALYRVPTASVDFTATVPGMIENAVTYSVELYTDDGRSTPASVKAFRLTTSGTEGGLDVTFDPNSPDVARVSDAPSP